ncbi:pre-mRNA 3'-end-processing factor FIP1-like [Rana temporaria]|uniref:pre-mRNA 3'-end-processing factor FIP1-like n=1 Tax=Rana temporaria TaxID=8407 RepID=UPI001AADA1D4|nr:pre-mRNA 3'-end-processing factor FIP1-like [Rana temporaria]
MEEPSDAAGGAPALPVATETLEEELWLYGGSATPSPDETGSTSGPTRSFDPLHDLSSGSLEQKEESLQITQSFSDAEEDSDTDSDDVEVTIGDIHTSCMESAGTQNVKGNRGYGAVGKLPPRGVDFAAPGCINGVPVLEVDLESFEEKPWRKPGADISDYFNYGFNEATWKVYCEKQRRLQLGMDSIYHIHSKENKIMVQQGRTGNMDRARENRYEDAEMQFTNLGCKEGRTVSETSQNGNQTGSTDAMVGEICNIARVEGRRWDIQESDEILFEVVANHGYKPHGMIQHQPPPPLLPPPNIAQNPPVYNGLPPPLFFQRPPTPSQAPLHPSALLPPPLVPPPPVHIPPPTGPPVAYNTRPPPHNGYYNTGQGVVNYHSVSTDQTSWVTTVDKGTSSLGGNDWMARRQREPDRPRNLNLTSYKSESDRYVNYNRERSYDCERKHRHSLDPSWNKEDKSRAEPKQKERDESSKHKSSSRRKQDSEEKETHRRHKRKKSKRGKEEKSADEEDVGTHGNRHELRE